MGAINSRFGPHRAYALLLAVSFNLTGCEGDGRVCQVSGRVTIDGEPVPAGSVLMMSEDGRRTSAAELQPDGTYRVRCQPGHFMVALVPPPGPDPFSDTAPDATSTPLEVPIPRKYQDVGTSGLEVQVPQGESTFDIDIDSTLARSKRE
ncbi:hypothetical protein Pan216_10770 [Planctomycetes bacterium Pan216]|uniref:Carboxypeptidase regulatory-like domain-containing protein n=1 Tax=Kolteria novifilia TaxID=2527975 RepID=A0A518AZR8_9BACT|nr:hypothetical protein Pan216_10770 [Planctomycetes bacterium Pan216]